MVSVRRIVFNPRLKNLSDLLVCSYVMGLTNKLLGIGETIV